MRATWVPVALTSPRFKGLLAAVGALMLFSVGAHAQWSDLGLSGHQVTRLRLRHGLLFACTNDGLHRKVSDTADSSWVLLGFGGLRVHDVLAVSPETLIVAREVTGTGADTVALFRSTDSGLNWHPFQNGLGATSGGRRVTGLLEPPGAPGTLLAATTNGVHKSYDGGVTWKQVAFGGRWIFLTSGISTIWGGGEGIALSPFVRRSTNGGENWTTSFVSGNCCWAADMTFDPSDATVAFLGLDSGLYRTANDGASWTPVPLPAGVSTYTLGARAFPPLRLYAAGYAPPVGATFFKSDDGGVAWTPVSFASAGSSFENMLLVRSGPAADTLFLGMGSGVLRYLELEVVGVDLPRESRLELRAQPNPFHAGTTLAFRLPKASRVTLRVLDSAGREVAVLLDSEQAAGAHRVAWNPRGLSSGTYFCQLRTPYDLATVKVVVVQ